MRGIREHQVMAPGAGSAVGLCAAWLMALAWTTDVCAAPTAESDTNTTTAKPESAEVPADPGATALIQDGVQLEFKTRVMTGWEYERERPRGGQPGEDDTDFGMFLDQARLGIDAEYQELLRLQVEFELSSANDPPAGVRDAWLELRFSKRLKLRVGRLKRPFSRLELRSVSELPMRGRGLGNDLIVEDMGYGERSLTALASGRVKELDLKWELAVSNPPPNRAGVDFYGRLEWDAAKWLEFGASAAHKIMDDPGTLVEDFIAGQGYNLDVRAKGGGAYLVLDAIVAEDLRFAGRPLSGSLAGYATYDIPVARDWAIQPVVFGEWADSDLEVSQSEAVRMVVGLNTVWHDEDLRIMPQVELVRPLNVSANTNWPASEAAYVMLAGQIGI